MDNLTAIAGLVIAAIVLIFFLSMVWVNNLYNNRMKLDLYMATEVDPRIQGTRVEAEKQIITARYQHEEKLASLPRVR